MLLEIFSFRLHHIQPHFRLTMLNHLQVGLGGGANAAITKNAQLNLCLESTSLRLITGNLAFENCLYTCFVRAKTVPALLSSL